MMCLSGPYQQMAVQLLWFTSAEQNKLTVTENNFKGNAVNSREAATSVSTYLDMRIHI